MLSAVEGNTIQNALRTYVGPDTTIKADAITNGDGGKVIVWADEVTRAYGSISVRGGAQAGNGGFVETSGGFLDVSGIRIDATAPKGNGGLWLVDPNNITIQSSGANTNMTGGPNFTTSGDSAILLTGTIEGQLNAGTSVSVTTGTAAPNADAGNITVSNTITKTGGTNATLTLNAHNDLNINASITSTTNQLNLVLNPDSDSNAMSPLMDLAFAIAAAEVLSCPLINASTVFVVI